MSSLNKREKKGVLIFAALAGLVIIIGIIMKLFDQVATGRVSSRGQEAIVNFNGSAVVAVGILMIGMGALIWSSEGDEG